MMQKVVLVALLGVTGVVILLVAAYFKRRTKRRIGETRGFLRGCMEAYLVKGDVPSHEERIYIQNGLEFLDRHGANDLPILDYQALKRFAAEMEKSTSVA